MGDTQDALQTTRVPRALVAEQWGNLQVLGSIAMKSIVKTVTFSNKMATVDDLDDMESILSKKHKIVLNPRSAKLVREWWKWLSFDGKFPSNTNELPNSMPSQWAFITLKNAINDLPFPLSAVLNQGVKITCNQTIPAGAPVVCSSSILSIEDKPRKTRMTVQTTCGTHEFPEAVVSELIVVIAKPKSKWTEKESIKQSIVHEDATLLGKIKLNKDAGMDFSSLSGDYNPIHISYMYARLAGFKTRCMQGYGIQALLMSVLVNTLCNGDQAKLKGVETRFISPLYIPCTFSVYVEQSTEEERQLWVCSPDKQKLYVIGTFTL